MNKIHFWRFTIIINNVRKFYTLQPRDTMLHFYAIKKNYSQQLKRLILAVEGDKRKYKKLPYVSVQEKNICKKWVKKKVGTRAKNF